MTAIRNFPNAPARLQARPMLSWHVPALALKFWEALQRYGQRRAAWELELMASRRALGDPVLARQLRAAAAECRRAALASNPQLPRSSS
jgi:hypothetical protein